MNAVIDWTYLPWDNQAVAGKVCWVCVVLGILFVAVTQVIRRTSLGYNIHQAPFVTMEMSVLALLLNTAIFALFFWYAAIAASLFISFLLYISGRGIQKNVYYEEKEGRWGLSAPLRKIRGELFSDNPIEQQLQWKQQVDATFKKLHPVPFFAITIIIPFLIVIILKLCGLPYIFVPHAIG